MTRYVVLYEQADDGGWGAYLPDLPGVVAGGETREEVERVSRGTLPYGGGKPPGHMPQTPRSWRRACFCFLR